MSDQEKGEAIAESVEVVLARWREQIQALVIDVRGWVEGAGWKTRTIEKPVTDRKLGRYMIQVLLMERDTCEVALNPVSPLVTGAKGAVDLYLVPAYDDIATLYLDESGAWFIYYSFFIEQIGRRSTIGQMPAFLSREALLKVLDSIASHAA